MILEDFYACVSPNCEINPKVFEGDKEYQIHISNQCKIILFRDIYQNPIDQQQYRIVFELTKNILNDHIAKADLYVDEIAQYFKSFLHDIRQQAHQKINENFVEVQRLNVIFHAVCHQEKDILMGLKGDLSYLVDELKTYEVLESSKNTLDKIYHRLEEIKEQTSRILTIDSQIKQEEKLEQIQPEQNEIVQNSSIKLNPLSPEWQNQEKIYMKVQMKAQPGMFKLNFGPNRSLSVESIDKKIVTSDGLLNVIKLCVHLKPFELIMGVANSQLLDMKSFSEFKFSVNLRKLSILLQSNEIQNIQELTKLKKLVNLTHLRVQLSSNQIFFMQLITYLKQLMSLTDLQIGLNHNLISNINSFTELKSMVNLRNLRIELRNNQISDLCPLSQLKSLVNLNQLTIDLHSNLINSIQPLSDLKSLVKLNYLNIDLSDNLILNIQPLSELQSMVLLTELWIHLDGNPLETRPQITSLQQLQNLE